MQTRALGVGLLLYPPIPGAVGPFPGRPDSSPVVRVPSGNAPDLFGHGQFADVLVDFRIAPPAAPMGADTAGPADHNAGFERYRRAHDIWNDVVSFGTFPQWMAGSTFAAGVADAGLARGASVLLPSERLTLNRGRKSRMRLSSRIRTIRSDGTTPQMSAISAAKELWSEKRRTWSVSSGPSPRSGGPLSGEVPEPCSSTFCIPPCQALR